MAIQRNNVIVRTTFNFSIPVNFRHEFKSPKIMLGGVPWKIHFRKIFKQIHPRVVGRIVVQAYLVCDYADPANNNWSITAGCVLRMMKNIQNLQPIEPTISMQKFENEHRMNELKEFIFWQEMSDEKFDFTHDHQFRFEAIIMCSPANNINKVPNSIDINRKIFDIKIEKIFENGSVFLSPFKLHDISYGLEFVKSMESLSINLHVKTTEYFGWCVPIDFNVKITSFDPKLNAFEKNLRLRLVVGTQALSIWKPLIGWLSKENCDAFTQMECAYVQITMEIGMWQPLFLADENSKINQITTQTSKCPMCWAPFVNQQVVATKCGHLFCNPCILQALEINGKCSFCNVPTTRRFLRVIYLK